MAGIKKLAFECEYKLDGKVLLLTIQGEGDSLITFSKLLILGDIDILGRL